MNLPALCLFRCCRVRCWSVLTLAVAISLVTSRVHSGEIYSFHRDDVLGTSFDLQVEAESLAAAEAVEAIILKEVDRLSVLLSSYSSTSELSRFVAAPAEPRRVSTELRELLVACDHWKKTSDGAFNPAVELLSRLWQKCAAENHLPSAEQLQQAAQTVQRSGWQFDATGNTVVRTGEAPLNLNAIAKGYIIDCAGQAAAKDSDGVAGFLLDIGGDLRVFGSTVACVGVASPEMAADNARPMCFLAINQAAVATSGCSQRGFDIGGVHYSHILDPRTGKPVAEVVSATVVAPDAAGADVLATVLNVLPVQQGIDLVEQLADTECLIVTAKGQTYRSAGWDRLAFDFGDAESPFAMADGAQDAASAVKDEKNKGDVADPEATKREEEADAEEPALEGPWGKQFELLVDFTVARPRTYRYERPYIALWIEDTQGKPIRTLSLWAGDFRWLPDLRRWYYLHYRDRKLIYAVSRPSRPPGRYLILWDGRANDGTYVPPGEYNVMLEAVREYGSYQIWRKKVTTGGEEFHMNLQGNPEISRVSIDYRRKEKPQEVAQK